MAFARRSRPASVSAGPLNLKAYASLWRPHGSDEPRQFVEFPPLAFPLFRLTLRHPGNTKHRVIHPKSKPRLLLLVQTLPRSSDLILALCPLERQRIP
jgi:hypothetical protein